MFLIKRARFFSIYYTENKKVLHEFTSYFYEDFSRCVVSGAYILISPEKEYRVTSMDSCIINDEDRVNLFNDSFLEGTEGISIDSLLSEFPNILNSSTILFFRGISSLCAYLKNVIKDELISEIQQRGLRGELGELFLSHDTGYFAYASFASFFFFRLGFVFTI